VEGRAEREGKEGWRACQLDPLEIESNQPSRPTSSPHFEASELTPSPSYWYSSQQQQQQQQHQNSQASGSSQPQYTAAQLEQLRQVRSIPSFCFPSPALSAQRLIPLRPIDGYNQMMARQSEEHELMDRLEADPYDVEVRFLSFPFPPSASFLLLIARCELELINNYSFPSHQSQTKIAEFIRLKAVNQSYEDAMEHSVSSPPLSSVLRSRADLCFWVAFLPSLVAGEFRSSHHALHW